MFSLCVNSKANNTHTNSEIQISGTFKLCQFLQISFCKMKCGHGVKERHFSYTLYQVFNMLH